MAVKGLRGFIKKENDMPGEKIELTKEEIEKIGNDKVFRTMTIEKLKQIVQHQEKQNGNIEAAIKSISKAYVKIASNTSAVKTYWAVLILVFGLIGVLFKIR